MGMIGDLIYPDNADMAQEANDDQTKLEKIHAVHNQLVNVYRELAEDIRRFDAYLMSALVLQYHLVYTQEDLESLPDTELPVMTQSLAEKIQSVGISALSAKMAISGVRALYHRIANIHQESGSFNARLRDGELSEEGADNLSGELAPQIDSIAAQSELVSSGNVDLLTNTELTTTDLRIYAGEVREASEGVTAASEATEGGETGAEFSEIAATVTAGAEAATEAVAASAEATEAAAVGGLEGAASMASAGAAALLGPAMIIVIVVTSIIETIEAAEDHQKLHDALERLRKMIGQTERSLTSLKKAAKSMLSGSKADIVAYNKMLARLYQLERNEIYNKSFGFDGLDRFIVGVDGLTTDNADGLDGYKAAVKANLDPAISFIAKHTLHDSTMAEAIMLIRKKVATAGEAAVTTEFLADLAEALGLNTAQVSDFNKFRHVLNDIAAALLPYHEQIRTDTQADGKLQAKPKKPRFGKMDPHFQPRPDQFKVPAIAKA